MRAPTLLRRHRVLRWLAPAAVAGVAVLVANGVFSAAATTRRLPRTDPTALIKAVKQAPAQTSGWSGTLVASLSLGLPSMPAIGRAVNGASLTSLLTGSHTMQIWYGGADKQRVALFGGTDETDLFHDGRQVWQWSSASRRALHTVLSERPGSSAVSALESMTPQALATALLAAASGSTDVVVQHKTHQVADRSVYDLVLTPRSKQTLVGSVHIAVDGKTKLPLGVRVYGAHADTDDDPAVDVAFTSIRFGQPAQRNFDFVPPIDAQVRTVRRGVGTGDRTAAAASARVVGSGWTSVVATSLSRKLVMQATGGALGKQATQVSGSWGRGALYQSVLLDVLVTDSGRVYAGAVTPQVLYAAASR